MTEVARCELCGEPMPAGESMFKFHGYSGPCPNASLTKERAADSSNGRLIGMIPVYHEHSMPGITLNAVLCSMCGCVVDCSGGPHIDTLCIKCAHELLSATKKDTISDARLLKLWTTKTRDSSTPWPARIISYARAVLAAQGGK